LSEDEDNFEEKENGGRTTWKGRAGREKARYQVGNMCESGMKRNDKRGLAKAVERTNGK
jgi:hypothetical protein